MNPNPNPSHLSHAAAVKTAEALHARGACHIDSEDLEQSFLLAQLEAAAGLPGTPPLDPDSFLAFKFRCDSRTSRAGVSLDDEGDADEFGFGEGRFEIPDIRHEPLTELLFAEEAKAQREMLDAMRNTPAGALVELVAGAGSAADCQDLVLKAIGSKAATPAARARTAQRKIKQVAKAAQGPQRDLFSFEID